MGFEPRDGNALRDLRHRRREQSTGAGAGCVFAPVVELVGCAAQRPRENCARSLVDSEPPTELTGIVPAHGLAAVARDDRQLRQHPRGCLEEELDMGRKRDTGLGEALPERERTSRIDDHDPGVSGQLARHAARVLHEGAGVAGKPEGKAATSLDDGDGAAGDSRGCFERVPRLSACGAQVAAAHEERVRRAGIAVWVGCELAGGRARLALVAPEAREHPRRGVRRGTRAHQGVACIEQDVRYGVSMVACLAAGEAPGASPGGGGMGAVHRGVAVSRHPCGGHLSPRRDRLARLRVGDGARAPTELRAEHALLELRSPRL